MPQKKEKKPLHNKKEINKKKREWEDYHWYQSVSERGRIRLRQTLWQQPVNDVIICTKKINLSRSDGSEGYLHWGDSPSLMIAVLACQTRSGDTGSPAAMKSLLKQEWRRLWTAGSGHEEIFLQINTRHLKPSSKTQVWMRGRRAYKDNESVASAPQSKASSLFLS